MEAPGWGTVEHTGPDPAPSWTPLLLGHPNVSAGTGGGWIDTQQKMSVAWGTAVELAAGFPPKELNQVCTPASHQKEY